MNSLVNRANSYQMPLSAGKCSNFAKLTYILSLMDSRKLTLNTYIELTTCLLPYYKAPIPNRYDRIDFYGLTYTYVKLLLTEDIKENIN